ncbi:disulfide bond formation protein B [Ketobacter sp. MCCC 1A13808]|uniref:disulfide bond formation protein B n=1 Tax=Ketobacter sp. MCCC 1A13808 TaxID=2602738 RepID=UPI000F2D2598|nr:disulfide bond formation protein B [Ketobacter sp. MCCC 1A13808]MVF14095.1 disulfide bond formation protein B [Ketobacter sp. MCCC 1A13808]RLP55121.1 MAG: disulfide bond formation protein B [Ketobacter sp.]
MTLPSNRPVNAIGVVGAIVSMSFAYFYLQSHLGLEACPLCLIDRGLVIAIGVSFLLAWVHNPKQWGQRIYSGVALLFSVFGIAVCWRHLWLQNLPKDQVPECSPGLDYMLETFPIGETLRIIFNSAGECADIQWSLMGLSIPAQTLLVFIGFSLLSLLQMLRKQP